LKPTTD